MVVMLLGYGVMRGRWWRELVDFVDLVDGVDDVDSAEGSGMANCRGTRTHGLGAEGSGMADCREDTGVIMIVPPP